MGGSRLCCGLHLVKVPESESGTRRDTGAITTTTCLVALPLPPIPTDHSPSPSPSPNPTPKTRSLVPLSISLRALWVNLDWVNLGSFRLCHISLQVVPTPVRVRDWKYLCQAKRKKNLRSTNLSSITTRVVYYAWPNRLVITSPTSSHDSSYRCHRPNPLSVYYDTCHQYCP